MDRWGIPLIGLVLFGALCAYCVSTEPHEIEEDLTVRSLAALQAGGIEVPPQGLKVEGQTAILSGSPGTPIVSEEARARVEAVWGITGVVVNPRDGRAVVTSPPAQQPQAVGSTTSTQQAPKPVESVATVTQTQTADSRAVEATINQLLEGKTIQFVPNRDLLMAEGRTLLREVARVVQASSPSITITIAGHTDSDGDPQKNQKLSERRAAAVRRYLVTRGVSSKRLTSEGYGATRPIAPDATPEGKARNRRIEFRATVVAASR